MSELFKKYKGFILGALLIAAVFVGYAILKPDSSDTTVAGFEKTLVDENGVAIGESSDPGAAFIAQLNSIQYINFKTEFFNDPVYKQLVDLSRPLGTRPIGRPNPFAPLGNDNPIVLPNQNNVQGSSGGGFTITSPENNSQADTQE